MQMSQKVVSTSYNKIHNKSRNNNYGNDAANANNLVLEWRRKDCSKRNDKTCFGCGKQGHRIRFCSNVRCFVCNMKGHTSIDCLDKKPKYRASFVGERGDGYHSGDGDNYDSKSGSDSCNSDDEYDSKSDSSCNNYSDTHRCRASFFGERRDRYHSGSDSCNSDNDCDLESDSCSYSYSDTHSYPKRARTSESRYKSWLDKWCH